MLAECHVIIQAPPVILHTPHSSWCTLRASRDIEPQNIPVNQSVRDHVSKVAWHRDPLPPFLWWSSGACLGYLKTNRSSIFNTLGMKPQLRTFHTQRISQDSTTTAGLRGLSGPGGEGGRWTLVYNELS
ncbi:hypothetical protein KGM_209950 [Danaus plexippus plexippus]|uniref:Uncharacterized protein n=1 Tax=Danaus plexippus plexippus TaxID=278856 RepID=A0A212FHS9_DANPL|nr:hypothetical protein KGM_209950 [Danaus plexippus plexippus]